MSGEDFAARLRRLRREPSAEVAPPSTDPVPPLPPGSATPATPGGPPGWLRARLAARARVQTAAAPLLEGVPRTVGEPARLARASGPAGDVLARTEGLPLDHLHGTWRLVESLDVDPAALALLTGDAGLDGCDLARAVFLDTETTGLSGGAGTYVYLVGLGRFVDGRFELWQGFLPDPAHERALLFEVARRVEEAQLVVSFFGKSFDRHRLEDKMRIQGVAPPFAARPHLDLYHPFQRLTKGRLPDGRLQTMERALCGLVRPDDLPGSLAPAAWFDYVAGRAHRLEGVFRHNRDDVLSLVTLAAYLGRVEREERSDGTELAGCAAARARAVARARLAQGDREGALPWLERAAERARAAHLAWRDLDLARAEALRALGRHDAARALYESLCEQPDAVALDACVGLAKLLEHGVGDPGGAFAAVERAAALLATGAVRGGPDLRARRERLARKLGR